MEISSNLTDEGPIPLPRNGTAYNARPGPSNRGGTHSRLTQRQRFPRHGLAPRASDWSQYRSMLLSLRLVPRIASTWEIWKSLAPFGTIVYIDIDEDKHGERTGLAKVRFEPPPSQNFWANSRCELEVSGCKIWAVVEALTPAEKEGTILSPLRNQVPAKIAVKPTTLSFGALVQPTTLTSMKTIGSHGLEDDFRLTADFRRRKLVIHFPFRIQDPQHPEAGSFVCQYRLDIKFGNVAKLYRVASEAGGKGVVIALESPPQLWQKKTDFERTHSAGRLTWGEQDLWARAVEITYNPNISRKIAASLDNDHQLIDFGRWTTYWLELDDKAARDWLVIETSISDWNIKTQAESSFRRVPRSATSLWSMLEGPRSHAPSGVALELLDHSTHFNLPFDVRYQLEVCISHDILHEDNISAEFLSNLANLANSTPKDRNKARMILEYAADKGQRIFDPMNLFKDRSALTFCPTTVCIPHYCALVRKVTVTPTRIYFNSPTVETTNRVLRHFDQEQDNFLRVQFTDELHEGRINGSDAQRDNEIYTRVFRVLNNGIRMGQWHWQFLAFGNSQIRENGAFFFCQPEGNVEEVVTCEKIRQWMGKFNHIKVVAKYAARLGQCFSTTRLFRGIPTPKVVRIPDIERHGYCFTDGVGKISPFLAQMVANDWEMDPGPSAFQFRMGGCKGVLVAWPDAFGLEVHIRKSQEKFHSEFNGLEIIRCSQFSVATLNRQTITILSSLGVPDDVFVNMLTEQLRNYDKAMTNPAAAVSLLRQYVDENQMTLSLAQMVLSGFMDASDPFTMTLLHLWRSWSIKALKERARIIIEEGAFVLGCVDETGTLKGYRQATRRQSLDKSPKYLPQIFIQVPDPKDRGTYKVITGLCAVGRNPSLHPGDIRVVEAVDVPDLRHLRDVVVFPIHGSRDIPSMCSGGDLDGDDFFVIWDQKLLPQEWFNIPMEFKAPPAKELDRDPTVQDLTTFFALYMKNNSLPVIAHAHLAQADFMDSGPKDARCIRLAELHSQAVDYVKTGVEAEMDKRLAPRRWPHFMERRGKASYHSSRVLGQLYDKVDKVDFKPSYEMPFDQRILTKYTLSNEVLKKARRIKSQYDAALRRLMGQMEIGTEFEVWTAFVLSRPRVGTQYKFHEIVRRESEALKQQYRDICIKEAGGSRDFEDLGPFAAAMYQVTWEEVQIALHESRTTHVRPDGSVGKRPIKSYAMPLISFPWLLEAMLCRIATGSATRRGRRKLSLDISSKPKPRTGTGDFEGMGPQTMVGMDYARTSDGQIIHRGEILRLFDHDDEDEDADVDGEIFLDSSSSPELSSMVDSGPDPENDSTASNRAQTPDAEFIMPLPATEATAGEHVESSKGNVTPSHLVSQFKAKHGAAALARLTHSPPALLEMPANLDGQAQGGKDVMDLSWTSPASFATANSRQGYAPTPTISDETPDARVESGQHTGTTRRTNIWMDCNPDEDKIVGKKAIGRQFSDPFLNKENPLLPSGSRRQSQLTEDMHKIAQNPGIPLHELSLLSLTNNVPSLPAESPTAVRLANRLPPSSPCSTRGTQPLSSDPATSRLEKRPEWDWTEISPRSKNLDQCHTVLQPVPASVHAKLRDTSLETPRGSSSSAQFQRSNDIGSGQHLGKPLVPTLPSKPGKVPEWDWTEPSPQEKDVTVKKPKQPPVQIFSPSGPQAILEAGSALAAQTTAVSEDGDEEPEFEEATLDIPEMTALDRIAKLAEK